MNRIIKLFIVTVFAFPFFAHSQSPGQIKPIDTAAVLQVKNTYVDAMKLAKIYSILKNPVYADNKKELKLALDSLHTLLSSYFWNPDDSANCVFTDLLNLNQTIKEYTKISRESRGMDTSSAVPFRGYCGAREKGGGNPEAVAINAVETFISQRAKEEVLYCAINKIMDIANDNKSDIGKKFKILFPATAKFVAKLKQDGIYYPSDFSIIKQMMEIDLRYLPNRLPDAVKFSDSSCNDMEKLVGMEYVMIRDGKKVQSIIDTVGNYHWRDENFKTTALYFDLFSNGLIDTTGTKNIWIKEPEIESIGMNTKDTILRDFFYGLLYQQFYFQNEPFMKNICHNVKGKADAVNFCIQFGNIKEIAGDLNKLKDSLRTRRSSDSNWVVNRTAQAINCINDISDIKQFEGNVTVPSQYGDCVNQAMETARLEQRKNYSAALSNVTTSMAQDPTVSTSDLRKITFFIQLSQIRDERQFAPFIESYMAPIGSSSLKRTAGFNISINGYLGLNGGYEWVTNSATGNKNNGFYAGVAAPIGFSFSFLPSKIGSVSLFLSIIDLGSVVNVRINKDSANYSTVKADQFFSPGIGLYYNIRGTPISLGGYLCRINDIRNITYTRGNSTITETGRNVVRLNFSALIDIPFFTLTNKEKKVK